MLIHSAIKNHHQLGTDDLLSLYVGGLSAISLFFWLLTIMLIGLYTLGNFQSFLDTTLISILRGVRTTALLSMLFAVWLQLGVLARAVFRKRGLISGSLIAVLIGCGSALTALVVSFLLVLFLPGV